MDHSFTRSLFRDEQEQIEGLAFDSDSVLKRLLEWFPGANIDPADYHVTQAKRAEAFLKTENLKSDVVARSEWKMVARESPAFRAEITESETGPIRFHVRGHSAGFWFTDPVSSVLRSRLLAFLESLAMPDFKISTARASRETPPGSFRSTRKPFHWLWREMPTVLPLKRNQFRNA